MARFVSRYLTIIIVFVACNTVLAVCDTFAFSASDSPVTLPGWDERRPKLALLVPAGYFISTKKNHDFDVYVLEPQSPTEGVGVIYVGHHPNLFHRQLKGARGIVESKEMIGGERVSVYEFVVNDAGQQRVFREAILAFVFADASHDHRRAELRVHISASGLNPEAVDRLWQYMCTVRLASINSHGPDHNQDAHHIGSSGTSVRT